MNWEMIAAITQVAGVLIVDATIIYLAIETKQNTDAILANSRQILLEGDLELLSKDMDYPENVFALGESVDEVRSTAWIIMFLRIRKFAWYQYNNKIIDKAVFDGYMAPIPIIFESDENLEKWG